MELILIGDRKLKIMLSDKDMEKYALKLEGIDYDNTETRRAFWSILDDVKHKTGFDAAGAKISVQLFRGRSGGCEMFVSKINEAQTGKALLEIRENAHPTDDIYTFYAFDFLLLVLKTLHTRNYRGRSSVYYDNELYYLVLENRKGTEFILEFAQKRENKNYIYHILEHCERMCVNNAVERLSPLY
ncbi:MAG: adaptor protein MecA [Clostridia bacterium]|nr:adaptor protein MecA [Clostridia bacterium]